jgi:cell wall-associated NlpC family hydrolase
MSLAKKLHLCSAALVLLLFLFSSNVLAADVKSGITTASSLNLRSGPGPDFKIVGHLVKGSTVSILGLSGDWYKVKTTNGDIVWANKSFITVRSSNVSRGDARSQSNVSLGQKLVDFAKQFLGVGYVWGGTSPNGFDCSGLIKYTYQNFGIPLERVASAQAKEGTFVSKDNLIPGDLVFFDTNGTRRYINHVGMYIGDGKFIQASSGYSKVVISTLISGFYSNTYMTARRILK